MARSPGLGEYGKERARTGFAAQTTEGKAYEKEIGVPIGQEPTAWSFPDSSRVRAYQYDPDTLTLRVRFVKYNTPWVYERVPTAVYQAFASAPSKGKYINSTLNFMPYRRATDNEERQHFKGV